MLNEVPVGGPWQITDIPDGNIPGGVDPSHLRRVQIPKTTTIEGCNIDVKDSDHYTIINKVEFLKKGINFSNKLCSFHQTVGSHAVIPLEDVAKMLDTVYPGERIPIQHNWSNLIPYVLHLGEDHTLGLGLVWVHVCAEL